MSKASKKELAQKYQKKTDIEHIKDAPDTYIGSIEEDQERGWMLKGGKMNMMEYSWVPGLFKCFDEGIVNARDHFVRLNGKKKLKKNKIIPVKNINITVDKETGVITMYNDGNGIDVEKHPEHKLWIPEMIFGHLRTGTNYDKSAKKIVGGKNGFGFKLVLIYALWGEIETVDHIRKKKYTQRFEDNLGKICKPNVSSCNGKPYTKVSWLPDYKRFGLENLTDDMFQMFKKRTWDIAAVTDKSVKVTFNNEVIPVNTFESFIDLYIGEKSETKRLYENPDSRWEYAVCISPLDEYTQVSYVNGIHTKKGGKHVDYIMNQIVKKLSLYIEKKKKIKVKPITIKEQLMLFLNCIIENPAFDSQTKECINTPVAKFGSKCEFSDKFIDKLAKCGIVEKAMSLNAWKDNVNLKKTDGKKRHNLRGIPKLDDANWAGGSKSKECTLILTEGDSAKSMAVSGLAVVGRDKFGVFPLRGKVLNVRDANAKKILENEEINNIKKIMGLQAGKEHKIEELRYGNIMIMTDQDVDGSHIKGLLFNVFDTLWPDLTQQEGFLNSMLTPIIKASKKKIVKEFYSLTEYDKWKQKNNDGKGWDIKYYKGLD